MFKKIRNLICLFFALTLFLSCSNLIEDRYGIEEINEKSHESDLCYVTLNLSENGSRTVLPSFSFDDCKFDLFGTLEGHTPELKFNKVTYEELTQSRAVPVTVGNWVFTVDCYDSTGTTKILTGTSTEYNINTSHNNIQVPMTFITGNSGSVNVKLNFPDGSDLGSVTKVTGALYSNLIEADSNHTLDITSNGDGTSHVVYQASGLESGLKRYIKFYLYTGTEGSYKELAHFVEAVVIADNLRSEGEYEIRTLKTSKTLTIKLKTDGVTYSGSAKTLTLKSFPKQEETIAMTLTDSNTATYSATVNSGTRYFLYDGDYNTKLIFFPAADKSGDNIFNGGIVEYCSSLTSAETVLSNEFETTSGFGLIITDSTIQYFHKSITVNNSSSTEYFARKYVGARKDKVSLNLENCPNVTTLGRSEFDNVYSLISISTPRNTTTIGDQYWYQFGNSYSLMSIYLNEGVKTLYISPSMALEYIHIPASLQDTMFSYYGKCVKLNTIDIADANPRYKSENGCVIAKQSGTYTNIRGQTVNVEANTLFSWPAACGDITIPDGVKKIDAGTFYQNTRITSVALPSSLETIGTQVFYGCTSIRSITIPQGVTSVGDSAFYNCSKLKNLTIPEGVITIGNSAFSSCTSLEEVHLPESVTSIGSSAFYNCNKLKTINIPNDITVINSGTFQSCSSLRAITIPANVTSIGSWAFEYCYALTSIDIPANVTTIGSGAFYNCNKLERVTLHEGLQYIYDSAFSSCTMLQNISFPSTLTSIGSNAFSSSGLVTAVIPDTVTNLGEFAYYNCSELKTVTIGSGVTTMGYNPFRRCTAITSLTVSSANTEFKSESNSIYSKDGKKLIYYYMPGTAIDISSSVEEIGEFACAELYEATSVSLKNTLKSIDYHAFYNCYGLTSLVLPASLTTMGTYAFYNCYGLTSVKFEGTSSTDGLSVIPEYAFAECYGLNSLEMCNSITQIDYEAFRYCNNLETIVFSTSLKTIGSGAFYDCEKLVTLNLPASLTSIGSSSFSSCGSLETVNFPNSLKTISDYAFSSCQKLTCIELPASIRFVRDCAFWNCNKLEEVKIPANFNMYYSTNWYYTEFDFIRNATKINLPEDPASYIATLFRTNNNNPNRSNYYHFYFSPNNSIENCATAVNIYTDENLTVNDEYTISTYAGERDVWYKISVESGTIYYISWVNSYTSSRFTNAPSNMNRDTVYIYDNSFNQITSSSTSYSRNFTPSSDTTYYIRVYFNNETYGKQNAFRVWTQSTTNP